MPKSLPSDPVTDRYMASLFAAIERRLSDTIQSDSSGETATDSESSRLFAKSPL